MTEPTLSPSSSTAVELTADIVAAYVGHNAIAASELPQLVAQVHSALVGLGKAPEPVADPTPRPAVPIRKSVTDDYIICLEDGKKLKSLKRHLSLLGMTPAEYREKWGLPADYPMVAPAYSAKRSELAKAAGLGRGNSTPRKGGRRRTVAAK
jgi:predicted transcriptional regulator